MKDFDLEYVKEHWGEAQSGKLLQTRDGKPVRLLCLDAKDNTYPIIGLVERSINDESTESWTIDGKYSDGEILNSHDLFIKSIKHKGWMNIYQDGRANVPYGGNLHDTKEIALKKRSKNAIATVKIEWEE
jgi:hypothetical protein